MGSVQSRSQPFAQRRSIAGRLLPVTLALSVACTGRPSGGESASLSDTDQLFLASARVVLPPAGVQRGDLPDSDAPGAQLLEQYCTQCHALPTPSIHSAADWPRVARRMWLRAEGVANTFELPVPDQAERLVMLRYLIDNALKVSGATLPPGPDRSLYAAACSRCHDVPDPAQYSPQEWPPVVGRMVELTEAALGETITQEQANRIEAYLETVSNTSR